MKTKHYQIPTVSGYFNNISTIEKLAVLHDAPFDAHAAELESYFNDLYHVFMHRLSQYVITDEIAAKEEDKLASMFLELVKTKRVIRGDIAPEKPARSQKASRS